jgi:acyl carrier protein
MTSPEQFMSRGSQDDTFKAELKKLIVTACNRETDPAAIGDDDSLIGSDSTLGLDSLDVLQVNVAITQRYGVRIDDTKHARRVMKTINTLADFLRPGP